MSTGRLKTTSNTPGGRVMGMTGNFIYPSIQHSRFFMRESDISNGTDLQARTKRASPAESKKRRPKSSQAKLSNVSSRSRLSELISRSELSRLSGISTLTDGELLEKISRLRATEKKIELSMLLYLVEVECRSLDLSRGYSSLYDFCTGHLKYSRSVAAMSPIISSFCAAGTISIRPPKTLGKRKSRNI